ncbi:Putative lipoprotein (plasmid) [Borrelia crocidurae str. Achema]|uniref:Putative lipoprotein n=1 Tax=Borrelia crocidurae (strain Achema) TaxID=1155096 RepID=I0FE56_BORCA|nr:Putative lipoprotein [Borrelia crocidurae str. Achema]
MLTSYNKFKSLIDGPEGFSNSFFDDMKKSFNADLEQSAQNNFYASLGFDAVVIHNFKRIITTFDLNKYYYDTEIGNSFIHKLRHLSLKLIVPIDKLLQENNNIGVLKDSSNMEGLKELAMILDNVRGKWDMFLDQVKNTINEAANLTVKNAVVNKLEIVNSLKIEDPNQQCVDVQGINNKLCDLKRELLQLFISVKDKVLALVRDVVKK